MSKHTPAPWCFEKAESPLAGFVIRRLLGRIPSVALARLHYDDQPYGEANARLMAASPELLQVAKDSLLQLEYLQEKAQHGTTETAITRLRYVIAKAEA